MGYAGSNLLDNGSKAVGANFIGINGTPGSTTLTSLKVTGYTLAEEEWAAFTGAVVAMKLDGGGKTVEDEQGQTITWQWADWYEMGEDGVTLVRKSGWQNGDFEFVGQENWEGVMVPDIPLAMGEGVWVQSDSAQWKIQCAGQVYDAAVPITLLGNGSKFCANPCPANIGLSQTFVANYTIPEEEWAAFTGAVVAMKLDGGGKTVEDEQGQTITWQWADWYEMGEDGVTLVRKSGWQNGDFEFVGQENWEGVMVPDIPLAIGEGVWVQSDSTEWQFVFPNVFELTK